MLALCIICSCCAFWIRTATAIYAWHWGDEG